MSHHRLSSRPSTRKRGGLESCISPASSHRRLSSMPPDLVTDTADGSEAEVWSMGRTLRSQQVGDRGYWEEGLGAEHWLKVIVEALFALWALLVGTLEIFIEV